MIYKGYTIENTDDKWAISYSTPIRYYIDHEKVIHVKDEETARYEIDELTQSHDMEEPKTPMTVTADKAQLMTLQFALRRLRTDMIGGEWDKKSPETFKDCIEWLGVIEQAIRDQKHDDEQLPFKS